jgi:hypothetical protein
MLPVPEEERKEVLGSLPRRRPGIESPRRARARSSGESVPAASEPTRSASELERLERIALSGVRVAAGAASFGLKLAGRTVGGLGRVVGRR